MNFTGPHQHNGQWWLECDHPDVISPIGPYRTKSEAEDDLRGLVRFAKYQDKPGFVTCCKGD